MTKKIFSCALSVEGEWRTAADEVVQSLKKDLQDAPCHLLVFFVSESYSGLKPLELSSHWQRVLSPQVLIGCNSSGVIGRDREIEMEPAMAVLAMHLPNVKLEPFYLSPAQLDFLSKGTDLVGLLDIYPTEHPNFISLADPGSCDIEKKLGLFNEAYPGCNVVGGLASGASVGVQNWLALDGEVYPSGSVGVALSGDVQFETVVSQGCRPIGRQFVITKADRHILYELAGRPALEVLKEVVAQLEPSDKALASHSLFAGLVMDEYQLEFKQGDFLVRNLMGYDGQTGALVVGAQLRAGQTLQFQLRDAVTSAEDLRMRLEKGFPRQPVEGALLVSCCGRGRGLYGQPNHDVRMIQALRGPVPLAGFFANGEIGPVGQKNYVHGYTSSLVIIR